jgi:two-component system OmpR family response regulator
MSSVRLMNINLCRMKRVLVVDDDPRISAVVTTWLELAGYAVETAGDFVAARLCLSRPKEILVVDVRLEQFNGLQLALQARSSDAAIHIVVMTGFDDPVLRGEAKAIGADFLLKPFDQPQLLRAVERC